MGLKRYPESDGKSATFWHFVTEKGSEANRVPAPERLARIAWPRALVIEADKGSSLVKVWKNKRHGRSIRWVIALTDFSYIVVLDDRGEYVLPWTAYTVHKDHSREKLWKEYHGWKDSQ